MTSVRATILSLFICFVACPAFSSDVSGRIVLQQNFKKSVGTGVYDLRGIAVERPALPQKSGAFDHVAVWLEKNKAEHSVPPTTTAKMQQIGRRFEPDFLIVPLGSTVEFPNLDPIFHNIFSLSRSQTFDLGYYAQGKSRNVTFNRPGIVQVYCHIHSDMFGVVVVAPGAWFGVPESDGQFSFSKVPPGEYRLAVWQRTTGLFRKKLLVPGSGTVHINISLPQESDE